MLPQQPTKKNRHRPSGTAKHRNPMNGMPLTMTSTNPSLISSVGEWPVCGGSSSIWPTRLALVPFFGMMKDESRRFQPFTHFFSQGGVGSSKQTIVRNGSGASQIWILWQWSWCGSCIDDEISAATCNNILYSYVYYLYMKLDMCHVNFKHISVIWQSMCYLLVQFHCAAAMIRTIYIQLTNSETNITLRQTTKGTRDRQ